MSAFREALNIPVKFHQHRAKTIFGCHGNGLGHFNEPMGLCFTNELGNTLIHVSDRKNARVLTFKLDGQIQSIFSIDGKLGDITSNGIDRLYIAISNPMNIEALVICYDLQGKPKAKFGKMFSLVQPSGVALNTKFDEVVVSSTQDRQGYIFNKQGTLLHRFGAGASRMKQPTFVACNAYNDIIVADTGAHNLKVLDRSGKLTNGIGAKGHKLGHFDEPRGVAVDTNNNTIVADSKNQRIQIFDAAGKFRDQFLGNLEQDGFPNGQHIVPYALSHCAGYLAVLLRGEHFAEVRIYDYNSPTANSPQQKTSVCVCQ